MKNFNVWRVLTLVLVIVMSISYIALDTERKNYALVAEDTARKVQQAEYNNETLNLSIEFGFDPMIVIITRALAANAVHKKTDHNPATWRFVKSERDLTYLILSLIQVESRGNTRAIGSDGNGSYGLTQLLLTTARTYDKGVTEAELMTIPKNLGIAMNHFIDLLEKYHGNFTLAVLAWNRGSGAVDRSIALGNSPENGYARRVFENAALRNAAN